MPDGLSRRMLEATRLTRAGRLAEASALLRGKAPDAPPPPPAPSRAFRDGRFANAAGERPYKLYVPDLVGPAPALVVMLHGCTQFPDDFAAGTRMNEVAESRGFLVLYPGQVAQANAQKCWNWFNAAEQQRGRGEPSIVAEMTRSIVAEHGIAPARVFVAGLSAGGAAAAVLGAVYPDLYAAIGVHSGLACGAARDVNSAFAAMRQGTAGGRVGRPVPAIVFHGDRDATVHPDNASAVAAQFAEAGLHRRVERGQVPGGHAWTRVVQRDRTGRTLLEQWTVHGAGHAWSGGSKAGSYTDPLGPDATEAMVRFFLDGASSGA